MNGWIYEYDTDKGFTAHRAFQHKNMGWYAFWGKPVNDKPALYHFNYNGFYVTQTAFLDGKWQTNRIYNTVPSEAIRLYQSQVNHPDYPHQTNQFGFEWQVHPDGVYDFLKLKHSWEEDKLEIFKNKLEEQERQHPSVLSSLQSEQMTRVFRNRQCLANVDENCDCDLVAQTADSDPNNLRIVKTQNLTSGKVGIFDKETVYETKLGFYDERNVYHEISETLNCSEDVLGQKKPVLFGNGTDYFLYTTEIQNKREKQFLYKFDKKENWNKEEILSEQNWGKVDFAEFSSSDNPIVFQVDQQSKTKAEFINAKFEENTPSSQSALILNELIFQQQQTQTGFTNPFVPIYCEGDDLSRADPKPTIIYKEVAGTKIEIPNMPAVKTQNELSECRAFSLAALVQWHTCDEWKTHLPDCKNLPPERAISYFGAMMYTHQDPEISETFQPNQSKARSMYDILNQVQNNGGKFILESCKPFDVLVKNFSTNGQAGIDASKKFFDYLKNLYETKKGKTIEEIKDCGDCVVEINNKAGLNATQESLKTALTKDSYDKFLYSLFFDGCKFKRFPASYQTMAYPHAEQDVTDEQLKNKIIRVLAEGKPVMFPNMCLKFRVDKYCYFGHSLLIAGYKKVVVAGKQNQVKEVFKVHNSWGEEWQKLNNNGWVDAEAIVKSVYKKTLSDPNSVSPTSLVWLGP